MAGDTIRPRPTGSFLDRDLGDEHLFYDKSGDRMHVLNRSARDIYGLCDGSRTLEQIAAAVVERYGVDEARALEDVRSTVDQLVAIGVLAA